MPQFGLWSETALLFTGNAEAIFGADRLKGRAAIGRYLLTTWGNGREGLPAGGLHTLLEDTPVLNLSADGQDRQRPLARILDDRTTGRSARWEQGISENGYVKEEGVWKISRLDYYLETAGPYETGWVTGGRDVDLVPFHYTSDEAGRPIPPIPDGMRIPAIKGTPAATLAALNRRIQAMNDEDKVANLQNAYGYYTDRKMWDDASDLFTDDAVLEIADVGIYAGAREHPPLPRALRSTRSSLRSAQQPADLQPPCLRLAAGQEARTRGVVFNMLGDFSAGTASLGLDVLENRFIKGTDGIWRIREMRIFPIMATDYYRGWAKSRLVTAPETGNSRPTSPCRPQTGNADGRRHPGLLREPSRHGQARGAARGHENRGCGRAGAPARRRRDAMHPPRTSMPPIADARRRLSLSVAYIAVDNISHALGNFIDDQQWHALGQLFAKDGWRAKAAVAFCVGPDHVEECERNYDGVAALPRASASGHWLIQPVIDVAPDGTSAKMRHRLLHIDAAPNRVDSPMACIPTTPRSWRTASGNSTSMAPDQPYFSSPSFKDGWARKSSASVPRPVGKNAIEPLRNFPPDVPRSLDAAPPSWFVARRHHRVAGHQADVVCLPQSGQRPCASALLSRPQDLRTRPRGQPLTGEPPPPG